MSSRGYYWFVLVLAACLEPTPSGTDEATRRRTSRVEDADPRFVDEEDEDFMLSADSPAFAIPGFSTIPINRIGIAP